MLKRSATASLHYPAGHLVQRRLLLNRPIDLGIQGPRRKCTARYLHKHAIYRDVKHYSTSSRDTAETRDSLVYEGIIFDMDGTLSVSCIDYQLMRESLDIPSGDLFTVMETWSDGDRILNSMDTILEIEARAAAASKGMPGLKELFDFLSLHSQVKVGLVTRNTVESMDAFFDAVGSHYRDVFDILMTREFDFVKPDKRCLLHFAQQWNIAPSRLLMVGDSTEDVECGNAAGTASCLILGGGNELQAQSRPAKGCVPTFAVESLFELRERLEKRDTPLGWCEFPEQEREEYASSMSDCEDDYLVALESGKPPPGMDFFDWLFESGGIEPASCSFPRINSSRQGKADDDHPGARILHLGCADGALTKMLFSSGLMTVGADTDTRKASSRGLYTIILPQELGATGLLQAVVQAPFSHFDALLFREEEDKCNARIANAFWTIPALQQMKDILVPKGGKIVVEMTTQPPQNEDDDGTYTLEHRISHVTKQAGLQIVQLNTTETAVDDGRYRCILSLLQ